MPFRWNPREHLSLGAYVLKWLLIAAPAGAVVGSAVAGFLWSLERATRTRWDYPWLLFLLRVAGMAIGLMYRMWGKSVEGGNNLIMEQIHEPGGGVPARMAPLVLIGTVVTHLFGGSAGREGTAVQMGGSIASTVCRALRLNEEDARTLLMAGMAAGFGAVFGTPLTGAVFALEVLAFGRMSYEAVVPCLIASITGDVVTTAWGIRHTDYAIASFSRLALVQGVPHLSWPLLAKVVVASAAFGLASVVFAELAHGLGWLFKRVIPWPLFRPAVGGALVIGLAFMVGADYLGLGVSPDPHHPAQVCILSCFREGGAGPWSWWWKVLFTAVTLSSGFKGGEVTPLFFVGAALGNTMAWLLGAPVDLFAGIGFVAVFAGATNTPLACTIMGIELFGRQPGLLASGFVVYPAVGCFLSYLLSGHSGIYLSQRIGTPKLDTPALPPDASLGTARALQPGLADLLANRPSNGKAVSGAARTDGMPHGLQGPQPPLGESQGESNMPHRHQVTSREIGQVRIYMTPREKRKRPGLQGMFGKPLYQEIIDAAKADGILNAVAHHTHYGYSGNGKVQANNQETPNPNLNLCVELISGREQLELFCRTHADLLKDKVIVYKHMEHWEIGPNDIKVTDASHEELDADVTDKDAI